MILNRVLFHTDELLAATVGERNCRYTRYADVLSFSGCRGAVEMLGYAAGVLKDVRLKLDRRKTNVFRRGRRQPVTGLVVNTQVSVPRTIRRQIRAAVHEAECGRTPTWNGKPLSGQALRVHLNYLQMCHPEEARKLRLRLDIAAGAAKKAHCEDRMRHTGSV